MNNVKEFIESPIPEDPKELDQWLQGIWDYTQANPIKAIAELAEYDYLTEEEPSSVNPIYQAAYNASRAYHAIDVEVNNEN